MTHSALGQTQLQLQVGYVGSGGLEGLGKARCVCTRVAVRTGGTGKGDVCVCTRVAVRTGGNGKGEVCVHACGREDWRDWERRGVCARVRP